MRPMILPPKNKYKVCQSLDASVPRGPPENQKSNKDYKKLITTIAVPGAEYLGITSHSKNINTRDGFTVGNNLLYRHKFGKTGRTITLGWNNSFGESESDGFTYSRNSFYNKTGVNYYKTRSPG